jgi:O-antigen/teichoic acid export membrane protein
MFAVVPRMILMIREKGIIYFRVGLIQVFLALILNIIFIIILQQKAIGVLKAGLITNIIMLPVYLFLQLKYSKITFDFKMAKNILKYSVPLLPVALSGWILNLSDRIFIDRFYTQADVGIYSLGYKIASVYIMIITSVRMAYIPLFYKLANAEDQINARKKIYQYNFYYYVLSLFLGFLIIFFSREVIGLFLNKKYFYSWIICAIITFASIFTETLFTLSVHQSKKTYFHTLIVGSSAILNLVLNWFLVPLWGIYGAAIATFICSVVMCFLFYNASKKCYFIGSRWFTLLVIVIAGSILNIVFWMSSINLLFSLVLKCIMIFVIVGGLGFLFKKKIKLLINSAKEKD